MDMNSLSGSVWVNSLASVMHMPVTFLNLLHVLFCKHFSLFYFSKSCRTEDEDHPDNTNYWFFFECNVLQTSSQIYLRNHPNSRTQKIVCTLLNIILILSTSINYLWSFRVCSKVLSKLLFCCLNFCCLNFCPCFSPPPTTLRDGGDKDADYNSCFESDSNLPPNSFLSDTNKYSSKVLKVANRISSSGSHWDLRLGFRKKERKKYSLSLISKEIMT